jgi:hypothetical protein
MCNVRRVLLHAFHQMMLGVLDSLMGCDLGNICAKAER